MVEIEERAAHNRAEQIRFIQDAAEDGLLLNLFVSTLDASPLGSPDGLAWGLIHTQARRIYIHPPETLTQRLITILDLDVTVPLRYLFSMTTVGGTQRSLTVLDTPAQQSSAAAWINDPTIRELFKIDPALPLQPLHPNHADLVPAMRRAAFKLLHGGRDE